MSVINQLKEQDKHNKELVDTSINKLVEILKNLRLLVPTYDKIMAQVSAVKHCAISVGKSTQTLDIIKANNALGMNSDGVLDIPVTMKMYAVVGQPDGKTHIYIANNLNEVYQQYGEPVEGSSAFGIQHLGKARLGFHAIVSEKGAEAV